MKKTRLAILAVVLAVYGIAQAPQLIPVWNGQSYTFPRLGPTLKIANGQIDTAIAVGPVGPVGPIGPVGPVGPQGPAGTTHRHVDVLLTYDGTAGGWPLPATARGTTLANLGIYVNGLRYHAGVDFSVTGGIVKALADNMEPGFFVTCDYDEQ